MHLRKNNEKQIEDLRGLIHLQTELMCALGIERAKNLNKYVKLEHIEYFKM